jgi:6-phosphogluconolactonase
VSGADIVVVEDPPTAASEAARRIADALHGAVADRGRADWATTGGSSAPGIYQALRAEPIRERVPWLDVHTWWGDDRFVRRSDPHSNVRPFDEIMLRPTDDARLDIPADHVHPFPIDAAIDAGRSEAECANAMVDEVRAAELPLDRGWPVFDLVLLGIGGDGHMLSVFPGSAALDATAWALDIPAPNHIEPYVERVTFNPAIVTVAGRLLVVVTGSSKADILGTILGPVRDPARWPAQLALTERATWIVDEAAAARLPR